VALGYNTPLHYPPAPEHDHLQYFHNALSIQAGCYQNGLWALAAAKAGHEEGCDLIGGSMIVAPTGEIVAQALGVGDEVITARIDLDRCAEIRRNIFDLAKHREPQTYGLLTAPKAG
jgi:predicted amidohydrolase